MEKEDIQKHARQMARVFEILYLETKDSRWEHIYKWLHMASYIKDVRVDSSRYDLDARYRSNIYHFELERSRMSEKHCTELAKFNFIWGSLESLIVKLANPTLTRSKTIYGCNYLKKHFDRKPILTYEANLEKLKQLIKNNSTPYLIRPKDLENNIWAVPSEGLFITSKIRNHFAHGSIAMPNLTNDTIDIETFELITVSSKLVLLTMQMLLLAHFKENNFIINKLFVPSELKDKVGELRILEFVELTHLPNYEENFYFD